MRIGLNALLLGRFDSGVEIYIRGLIRALARFDRDNDYIVYITRDAPAPDAAGHANVELCRVPFRSGSRAVRILWEQARMPRMLVRDGIDVLHSLGYVMPVFSPVPTVVTMHDVIALKHPDLCRRSNALHYGLLLPRSARRASRIIASSEATKADIVDLCGVTPEKIDVIYPGVDELFRDGGRGDEEVRAAHSLPERYILFVGNIEPKKNLPVLIKAYRFLRANRGVDMPLLIVGNKGWKWAPVFDAVRSLGLSDHVLFRGYVDREDLPGIFRMAEVFVFPSIVEGFGLPPLEAMATGVPVVTSNAAAIPEAVGDAAITVPPGDPVLLGRVICKVLENSFLRASLIARGRERVERFSWARAAEQMVRVYRSLCE